MVAQGRMLVLLLSRAARLLIFSWLRAEPSDWLTPITAPLTLAVRARVAPGLRVRLVRVRIEPEPTPEPLWALTVVLPLLSVTAPRVSAVKAPAVLFPWKLNVA